MKKITSSDISVVVQGPLHRGKVEGIERCLQSIKAVLPDAEIIVSTWLTEDVSDLASVTVVQSEDPGPIVDVEGATYNLNRQLVSTLAGMQRASRPYLLKFRADLALADDTICCIDDTRRARFFREPVTVPNIFVRHPERYPMTFHMTDIAQFGRKEDLLAFWSGPVFREEEVFTAEPYPHPLVDLMTRVRLVPEQALTLRWLAKVGIEHELVHSCAIERRHLVSWSQVLVKNFHVLNWEESGICFPARFTRPQVCGNTLVTEKDMAVIRKRGFSYARAVYVKRFGKFFYASYYYGKASLLVRTLCPPLYAAIKGQLTRYRQRKAKAS